jgi:pyruvate/2-oxoglutarate dehydrogenase complex dihydrolipoamide dehydrogenase (E3) component
VRGEGEAVDVVVVGVGAAVQRLLGRLAHVPDRQALCNARGQCVGVSCVDVRRAQAKPQPCNVYLFFRVE